MKELGMRTQILKNGASGVIAPLMLFALSHLYGCNESKFQASQEQPVPKTHMVNFNGIDDQDAGTSQVARIDNMDFTIQAAAERVLHSEDAQNFPIDLYFLVDTTNSMTPSINAVRDSIVALAGDLKDRGMDLNAGFIGFIDTEQQAKDLDLIRPLSADIHGLQDYVSGVEVANPNTAVNSDYPEASLWAVNYAISRLNQGEGRANAAKVLLLITDVVGHDGLTGIAHSSNHTRNCDVAPIRTLMNNYASNLPSPDLFRFYYVVPDVANPNLTQRERQNAEFECNVPGFGPANAKQQMEHLMQGLQPNVDPANRGGPLLNSAGQLAWPLQDHNLAETLANALQTTRPVSQRLLCEARGIQVLADGETIYTWQPSEQELLNSNSIRLDQVIEGTRNAGEQTLEFKVDRCCMEINESTNDVDNRQQCVQRFEQTIRYRVVNR